MTYLALLILFLALRLLMHLATLSAQPKPYFYCHLLRDFPYTRAFDLLSAAAHRSCARSSQLTLRKCDISSISQYAAFVSVWL
ncbi:hypothetical protein EV424DRAFT_1433308 [Suillus variegatus]|nr:hypothetical protein EV424DRAFT_1433308 [Suillus variegatus]